jgi:hypothetical protein
MRILSVKYILLLLFLYIYLYNPIFQILDFGLIKILLLISILYIIVSKKIFLLITLFKNEIVFSLVLIAYSSLVVFWGDGTAYKVPYTHLVWFLECFIIPFFFFLFFKDIFQNRSWESIIVKIGLIAALITLFLILNPKINFYIRDSLIKDFAINISNIKTLTRGFTIAENSTYNYGIIQGLVLGICLLSIKKNYAYAIPLLFLFVAILFNARIGFACVVISVLLVLFRRKIKLLNIIIFGIVICVGYFFLFKSEFSRNNLFSLKRGFNFFVDSIKFITGDESHFSNYSILFNKMIFFPSNLFHLIFGEGRIVFYASRNSDIGYINQIFTGGLLYLFLMLSFLFYMFLRNFNLARNKLYPLLFFLTILIVNIKGNAFFVPNGFFRLITFYYVYCIIKERTDYLTPLNQIEYYSTYKNPVDNGHDIEFESI